MKIIHFCYIFTLSFLILINCASNPVYNKIEKTTEAEFVVNHNENNYKKNDNIENHHEELKIFYDNLNKKPNNNENDFIDYCFSLIEKSVPYGFIDRGDNTYIPNNI